MGEVNLRSNTVAASLIASLFFAAAVGFAGTPDGGTARDAARASQDASGANPHSSMQVPPSTQPTPSVKAPLDRTGKRRVGKASFYAGKFSGKKMADGKIMDPRDNNAASKTLPLGTIAKVTNLETGKSAVVTIEDRGPYVGGRIVDLSPATAQKIGIDKEGGVAKVEVAPIAVPLPDGGTKLGVAADSTRATSEGKGKQPGH